MEYRLKIDDETVSFRVDRGPDRTMTLTRDGVTREVGYVVFSPNHLRLEVDGRGVDVYLAVEGQGKTVIIRGVPYYLEDADRQVTFAKKDRARPEIVTPPMPAVVVGVFVAEGDRVVRGARVLTVSAMKMETTLTAPHDGLVTAVKVTVGDQVMPGQVLVDIAKESGSTASDGIGA